PYNNFVAFRRDLAVKGKAERATLRITADSRYEVYVNGAWLGFGPPRSWPAPWPVDEYDLSGLLQPGRNVVAVLVQHFGTSTFQYLHCDPGLLAQVDWTDAKGRRRVVTDRSWHCVPHQGYAWPVARISVQQGWEEQFDARNTPPGKGDWRAPAFEEDGWERARIVRRAGQPPHGDFELRDIPMLTRDPVEPVRVAAVEAVRPAPYTWSLSMRSALELDDRMDNQIAARTLLVTHVRSDQEQAIELHLPHGPLGAKWKLNGTPLQFSDRSLQHTDTGVAHAQLVKGWNTLMVRPKELERPCRHSVNIWTERPVAFSAIPKGARRGADPWLLVGPFAGADPREWTDWQVSWRYAPQPISEAATAERFEEIWKRGALTDQELTNAFSRPVPPDCLAPVDVFSLCASEHVDASSSAHVEDPTALQHDNADWTTILPADNGADTRILLDFGREVVGFHEFELDAPAGAILDDHNFEFIQRDGRINLCEGMQNSFRYVCREGRQRYCTFVRRGFRYSWLTFRHFNRPIRVRFVRVLMSTYPQARQGDFACSDELLNRIWEVGARSVECCSEDTYVDCPTYEQTHWVGDARNEALVDLVVNGDPRLSRHCWIQVGRSLGRSPIVESEVPSGWQNILPAWSFLWMRWAEEHYALTGDKDFGREALGYLDRNVQGIEKHLNAQGLFEIPAWNMFDWAPMDTPTFGVVTHQNCLAVLGLRQAADLALQLGQDAEAERWSRLAGDLSRAINRHLWSTEKNAYYDSIHQDGQPSQVFSQQTQTAAYIAGVATGERAKRCRAIIAKAPKGFVEAGSPFFMFFLLEALEREGRAEELIDTIRDYWGKQIEAGATTFWEMYHPERERMTRSHCHGWSAAPTFFLSQNVIGVRPLEPGYAKVLLAPRPGDLAWAHGKVPTPRGVVECRWTRDSGRFTLEANLPPDTPARIEIPFSGKLKIEQGEANKIAAPRGTTIVEASGPRVVISVSAQEKRPGGK
ncbi:MAG: family 78 glycoside hydrolase catalytic domain, partial [Candidatus Sumerlaeota bacterium]|nr:family 78 glycoside hydrolase catalytic domain [Candidatus Sumerlaeota bacterium]